MYSNSKTDPIVEALQLVSAGDRRKVLRHLNETEEATTDLETLTDSLASGRCADGGPLADGGTLQIDLHHIHLPRLEEAGVIEYNPDERIIRPDSALIEALLDTLDAISS